MRRMSEGIVIVAGILLGVMALFLGGIFQFFFVMIVVWVLYDNNSEIHDLQSKVTEMEKKLAKAEASQGP